jgi:predicted amidohydrolase
MTENLAALRLTPDPMDTMKLQIATCQFPVSADIASNARYIRRQMRRAKESGAHVVHFCEGALSGYAGADFDSFRGFDWAFLKECTRQIVELAGELKIWVLLGSSHRLSGSRKPHNCVYVIDERGKIVNRYDKRFCAGDPVGRTGDLRHYTPGDQRCVFTIRGIRCGVLICYDYRYPELYRDYKKRRVELVFHSYHAANVSPKQLAAMQSQVGVENQVFNHGTTYPEITMPATMQAAAASSHVWISCSNSSARESCWPAFFVRADGVVTGRLRKNTAGVLLSTLDNRAPLYDSTNAWRGRAMRGVLHSGKTVNDVRSRNRTTL